MKSPHTILGLTLAAVCWLGATVAQAGEKSYRAPLPPEEKKWELRLSVPGWLAGVEGTTGLHGSNSHSALGFGEIVPHVDMAFALRAELRKGRFGIYSDFLYMSLSDGIGSDGLVKKISGRQDEYLADLGLSWRLLESDRGYLELIGGVRYVNLFEEVELQGNDERIGVVSNRLAAAGTISRALLARELNRLTQGSAKLPVLPLSGATAEEIRDAALRVRRNTNNRADRIASKLRSDLNRRVSRSDDWYDPYLGLRGRYNLNEKYYLTGRADIGGFGVGSDLSWQASAGIGCQLSPRVAAELTYRALGMDYDHDGFVYDMVTHGPEFSLILIF